jgi:RNA polymerase sigma-70 factor (ECF subfamily)
LVKNDLDSTAQRKIDAELVHRVLEGNEDACAALFHAHRTKVYSLCRRMTSNPAEAEDLTQDAFLQAFCKLGTFRGDSALSSWLYRVATNTVLMHLRKKSPRQVWLESPNQEGTAPKREYGKADDQLRTSVDRIALTRAMKELPVGYRTVFVMHEVKGYEHHEIARLLRCSVGNSKSQLHRAKARMRELLGMQKVQDGRGTAKQQSTAMGEPGTRRRRFLTGQLRGTLVLATSEKAAISF